MSCIQLMAGQPASQLTTVHGSLCAPKTSLKVITCVSTCHCRRLPMISLDLATRASTRRHRSPVCLFGGKGRSDNQNEASPWKALEKAMGNLKKEQSVEDLLRQQIEKQEYFDDGGSGGIGGGGGGDSGASEDEDNDGILDEALQVIFATLGFIFLYIYIIDGEDITRLAKDFIKFIFGGKKTFRLNRLIYQWGRFFQRLSRKPERDEYWLENAIISTPTWWDSPEKYRRILRAYLEARSRSYDGPGCDFGFRGLVT